MGGRRNGARRASARAVAAGMHEDGAPVDPTELEGVEYSRAGSGLSPTAWRRKPMPPGWYGPGGTREQVLKRDGGRCKIALADRCDGVAVQVDHIDPDGPESMDNYQAVCIPCHRWKTGVEGAQGKARKARDRKQGTEKHPGLL